MKTDKYKDPIKHEVVDDNIKMEVPDIIATDMATINFKKKVNTVDDCHVCAQKIWGRPCAVSRFIKKNIFLKFSN